MMGALLFFEALGAAQTQRPQVTETTPLIRSLEGSALYKEYCAVCHGQDGKGGGPFAKSVKIAPADLTLIAKRNGGRFPGTRVERIITGEDAKTAGHGTREMPLWGPIFSQIAWDQDLGRIRVGNLTKYIEGLQAK
jgi:mono/diheme cytochrome c family protein